MKMVLWIALLITAIIPIYAQQYDPESDFEVRTDGKTIQIKKYVGTNQTVRIPQTIQGLPVVSIGNSAFSDRPYRFRTIAIPDSVIEIEHEVFFNCTSLIQIFVYENNSNYSSDNGVLYNKNKTILIQCPLGKIGVFTIPNSVTSIKWGAFDNCDRLTSINIPSSVTSIGSTNRNFHNCISLSSINVDAVNSNYSSQDGVLYNKAKTTLIQYPAGKRDISFTIPHSVTTIGNEAFFTCKSLASVTIPESVTSIENSAFASSVLTSIIIPNSVISIKDYAFKDCNKLISVTFQGTISSVNFSDKFAFPSDLRSKFYATDKTKGTPGTYVFGYVGVLEFAWTKQ
jgi:hypothetical protein